MWLSQLRLVNFRNLHRLTLELQPGIALFVGHNGQGKTNLLESVYVLATTRSPRTSAERELVTWQSTGPDRELADFVAPFTRLEGRVQRRHGEVHLEVLFKGESAGVAEDVHEWSTAGEVAVPLTRVVKVDGLPRRATELIGNLPVVYFSPGDVVLAGGPPSGRRQYLNIANSQTARGYMRALQRYNRVLLQRNQVLRQIRERRQPRAALEPWTEELITTGVAILRQRLAMVDSLNGRAGAIFRDLTGTDQELRIVYRCTAGDAAGGPEGELAAPFRARQEAVAAREVDQAASLVGPHRDDFVFMLGGVDLNTYGSRGQQRLAVLALKLAEVDWMGGALGEPPVLLLDDVLSELDPRNRGYVVDRVARVAVEHAPLAGQVWITTSDAAGFSGDLLASSQTFEIDAGQVRRA